ncbi:hypothetical protein MTO96_041992 [Rhipicephalus appendiculatus]
MKTTIKKMLTAASRRQYSGLDFKQQARRKYRCILHPRSRFRRWWDIFILVMLLMNLVLVPLHLGFFRLTGIEWQLYSLFSDFMRFVDMMLNFRTSIDHRKQGMVIIDPVQIRQHYLQGWFPVDLVSSLPLELLVLNWPAKYRDLDRRSTLSQLDKLISFVKLIKISRLFSYGGRTEQIIVSGGSPCRAPRGRPTMAAGLRAVGYAYGGRRRSEQPGSLSRTARAIPAANRPSAQTLVGGLTSRLLGASPLRNQPATIGQPPQQPEGTHFLPTSLSAAATRMSRCNSSTTVEIVEGGSCPSRSRSPSPSVCIMSATEPRPPSPSVCIVTESSRPPSPSLCVVTESARPPSPSVIVVKEEARSPSFSVARSKRTSSPTTVYVVSEGEQQPPRKPARSPNVCIVTSSSPPPPRRSPDVCIVTEDRPPSPGVCIVSETRRSPSPRVEVIEAARSSSSTIVIEE